MWMFFTTLCVFYFLTNACSEAHSTLQSPAGCRICRCKHLQKRRVYADCSNLGLKNVPKFPRYVSAINFSGNRLNIFPQGTDFPQKLIYLDMSRNVISRFQNGSFETLSLLQELYLQSNKLFYNSKIFQTGLFKQLRRLEILNLKKNAQRNDTSYPEFILQDLQSLEQLYLDGLEDASFGPVYKHLTNLTLLDLSGKNGLCEFRIIKSNHFKNFPYLRVLNISQCQLIRIEKGAFGHMSHLRELDISYNQDLSFAVAENVSYDLQFTDIRILNLRKLHRTYGIGTQLFKKDIIYLQNTSLEEVYLDSNRLELLEKGVLQYAPKNLSFVSFGDNKFMMGFYLFQVAYLENLRIVNASYQFSARNSFILPEIENPGTCDVYTRSPCQNPNSPKIEEQNNFYYKEYRQNTIIFRLPPNLQYIHLNQGLIKNVIPMMIFIGENDVRYVNLSGNILYQWKGPFKNWNKIKVLDLSSCFCSDVDPDFFLNLGSLEKLYISDNLLGFVLYKDDKGKIFSGLWNLQLLDLSQNRITTLPSNFFLGLVKLMKLNLSGNLIRAWEFRIDHMKLLRYIDLSNNQIFYIQNNITDELDVIAHAHEVSVSLLGNILLCKCEYLHFLQWANEKNNRVRLADLNKYICQLPNGTKSSLKNLQNIIHELDLECYSKIGLIVGLLCAILLSICIMIYGIVYRYRWKLRYWYYIAKNRYRGYDQLQADEEGDYEFDAFVSYAEEDGCFVYNDLRKSLELAEDAVSLCIHGRDFMPGLSIAANITKAINSSRKTVIVLSRNFLRSEWCMYEFNMARMESIYNRGGRNVMFIIFYEPVQARDLPMTMLEVVESNSYIEYPNDPQGNIVFWEKIKETIKKY